MSEILKVYTIEDKKEEKFLRKVSKEVDKDEIKSKEFQTFLDNLIYTAKETVTEEGYLAAGLAAIQLGVDKKVFCILKEDRNDFLVLINPEFKPINDSLVRGIEGCLSIPRREGYVLRYKKIKVKYLDRDGKVRKEIFSNQEAREVQHEYDHTQGVLFIDKLVD